MSGVTYIHTYITLHYTSPHFTTLNYIHSFIHSLTHSFIHSINHSFIHSFIRSLVHSFIRSFVHSFIHTYIHTYINTYIHTHIHTYIHTYIHNTICKSRMKMITLQAGRAVTASNQRVHSITALNVKCKSNRYHAFFIALLYEQHLRV